jgi:hypothetical protein
MIHPSPQVTGDSWYFTVTSPQALALGVEPSNLQEKSRCWMNKYSAVSNGVNGVGNSAKKFSDHVSKFEFVFQRSPALQYKHNVYDAPFHDNSFSETLSTNVYCSVSFKSLTSGRLSDGRIRGCSLLVTAFDFDENSSKPQLPATRSHPYILIVEPSTVSLG